MPPTLEDNAAEYARVIAEFYRYTPAAMAAAYRRMTEPQRAEVRRLEKLGRYGPQPRKIEDGEL